MMGCCQMVWSHMHESACIIFILFLFLLLFPLAVPNYWCMMSLPAFPPPPFFFNINIKSLLWDTVLQVTPKMLYTGLV